MQQFFVEQTHAFHGHYNSLSWKTEQEFVLNPLMYRRKLEYAMVRIQKRQIPLGQDQALQLEPTRAWSFPNLEDPTVMSFYVKHINHVRGG